MSSPQHDITVQNAILWKNAEEKLLLNVNFDLANSRTEENADRIKARLVRHLQAQNYPASVVSFTGIGSDNIWHLEIAMDVKKAPEKVLALASRLKEKGLLEERVTIQDAAASTGIGVDDFLQTLNETVNTRRGSSEGELTRR